VDNATWHVLGDQIVQTTTLKAGGGGLQDVYEVPYIIDTGPAAGHSGKVTIAATAFNQATISEAINQQVGAVHAVAALKG
jgi:hypothetical protein